MGNGTETSASFYEWLCSNAWDGNSCYEICRDSNGAKNSLIFNAEVTDGWMTYSLCWDCEEVSNGEHVKRVMLCQGKPIKISDIDLKLLILSQFVSDVCRRGSKLCTISSTNMFVLNTDESGTCFINVDEVWETALYYRAFCACACETAYDIAQMFMETLAQRLFEGVRRNYISQLVSAMGLDAQVEFMRSLGFLATKWISLKTLSLESIKDEGSTENYVHSYAQEGFANIWAIKGWAPLLACLRIDPDTPVSPKKANRKKTELPATNDTVARYVLSHQQVETTVQLARALKASHDCLEVHISIDNVACEVARLGAWGGDLGHVACDVKVTLRPNTADVVGISVGKSYMGPTGSNGSCWSFKQWCTGSSGIFQWSLSPQAMLKTAKRPPGWWVSGLDENRVVFAQEDFWHSIVWRLGKGLEGQRLTWSVNVAVVVGCVVANNGAKENYNGTGKGLVSASSALSMCEFRRVEWNEEVAMHLCPKSASSHTPFPLRFF